MTTRLDPRREYHKITALCVLLLIVVWIGHIAGCSSTSEQPGGDGMPQFEAAPVTISGELELSNGTVVDLGAGVVLAGGEGIFVRRLDLDLSGGVLMDARPQMAHVEWRSSQLGQVWTRCATTTFDVLQWSVTVRPPLSQACGTPGLVDVRYAPFRPDAPDDTDTAP
jgi:hypothetical protein